MSLSAHAQSTATQAQFWAVLSDVAGWPAHLPTFEAVSAIGSGHTHVGSRFAVRQPGLPPTVYEVTEWTPGSSFTWVARSRGVLTTARHTLAAHGDRTELTLTVAWSGPLAPLVRLLLSRKTQRMIECEATALAEVARTHG